MAQILSAAFLVPVVICFDQGNQAIAQITPRTSSSETQTQTHKDPRLRAETDLVLVPVTVTDQRDHLVMGLQKKDFSIFDQNEPEVIGHFSTEDAPISLGIIFDTSSSMYGKIERSRQAVIQFLRSSNPADEFFLIGFNDRPKLLVDFTSSIDEIQATISEAKPDGTTALLDAVYLGLDRMKKARR